MKKCNQVAYLTNVKFAHRARIYGIDGLSPTITTNGGGGHEVKIMDNRPVFRIAEATKKGYAEATIGDSVNIAYPNSKTRRGRVGHGVAQTLTCCQQQVVITEENEMAKSQVRKLTPRECWRLMGFDDSDFDKARQVNSDTQLYKQAGNSIVVNVVEAILGNLLVQERSSWLDDLLAD